MGFRDGFQGEADTPATGAGQSCARFLFYGAILVILTAIMVGFGSLKTADDKRAAEKQDAEFGKMLQGLDDAQKKWGRDRK